ncbi:MAG: hypothetical protein AB2721_17640 [Candidatus Thiodiazotropha sp.]
MLQTNFTSAFVCDNARNEDDDVIVDSFVIPDRFWELFSPIHQVIIGSRGSGKTAIAKMASFPFLRHLKHKKAEKITQNLEYVGVFLNTDLRFVGSLKTNVWQSEHLEETYFVWKFNINCLKSFIITVDDLLNYLFSTNYSRYEIEQKISKIICNELLRIDKVSRLQELESYISDYEYKTRAEIHKNYLSGIADSARIGDMFSTELFEPIQYLIRILISYIPEIRNTKWIFLIDEAEFLTVSHQTIINSFMRTNPGNIFVKMATLPYYHHSLSTNLNVSLQAGDDFQYVLLDLDPIYSLNSSSSNSLYDFSRKLFKKRILHYIKEKGISIPEVYLEKITSLDFVLGPSPLQEKSPLPSDLTHALELISPYLDEKTIGRATEIISSPLIENKKKKFGDQIWRKVSGYIKLKDQILKISGRQGVSWYSGVEVSARCTDGVPRRMINLFQEYAREIAKQLNNINMHDRLRSDTKTPILTKKTQSRILKEIGDRRINNSYFVPEVGPKLRDLIEDLGRTFEHKYKNEKFSTEIVSSFTVEKNTSEKLWGLVKEGVAYGFIFPDLKKRQATISIKGGKFRLGFQLYPKYNLYPSQGRARTLQGLMRARKRNLDAMTKDEVPRQFSLLDSEEV